MWRHEEEYGTVWTSGSEGECRRAWRVVRKRGEGECETLWMGEKEK